MATLVWLMLLAGDYNESFAIVGTLIYIAHCGLWWFEFLNPDV